jgi:hypothetical protein
MLSFLVVMTSFIENEFSNTFCIVNYGVVGAVWYCIIDGCVVHECTDVPWVSWIVNLNTLALLHNNNMRNNRLLHHQGSSVLQQNLWCPELLHRAPKYKSALSHFIKESEYYTKAPKYFTTTYAAPSFYTEALNYYTALKESSKKVV